MQANQSTCIVTEVVTKSEKKKEEKEKGVAKLDGKEKVGEKGMFNLCLYLAHM